MLFSYVYSPLLFPSYMIALSTILQEALLEEYDEAMEVTDPILASPLPPLSSAVIAVSEAINVSASDTASIIDVPSLTEVDPMNDTLSHSCQSWFKN